jgi:hypothetical protein
LPATNKKVTDVSGPFRAANFCVNVPESKFDELIIRFADMCCFKENAIHYYA